MSDQTPGTQSDMAEMGEPTMEDILSSIRKIIADDDSAVLESPLESPENFSEMPVSATQSGEVELDVSEAISEHDAILELGETDLAIAEPEDFSALDLVSDEGGLVDLEIPDIVADEADPKASDNTASVGVATDNDFDDELAALMDMPIAETAGDTAEVAAETISDADVGIASLVGAATAGAAAIAPDAEIAEAAESDDDLIDLDGLLADMEEAEEETFDAAEDADLSESGLAESGDDPDLVLVKSLMADLTEEDEGEDAPELTADEADEDVMSDILDMALDDELSEQEVTAEELSTDEMSAGAIAEMETENTLANAEGDAPSLSDIAAAAEAEVSDGFDAGDAAIAGGAAALVAAALTPFDSDDDLEIPDPENPEMEPETASAPQTAEIETESTPEETATMAKAAKSETIMDEVTETATADVFASLNQMVEEKAVVAERGDRIGDLVMEALRPMLKDWLDANLKGIVERAVTKEVKRISSGK